MENQFTQLLALDDVNLPHSLRRSIWLIRDEEDSNNYTADEILDDKSQDIIFNMRSTLTGAYKSGDPKYVCPFCGEPIGLKVRTFEGDFFPFFSHYQDSDDTCPLKTTNDVDPSRIIISSENHFKESVLHQDMVSKLKEILELSADFKKIEVNKVISTPEVTGYRRPSLYSIYRDDNKVCFDALISNPQIGLLVGRNAFYKMQKMFYLWVFPDFSVHHQRMCEKDILYMNRRNVFVFDSLDYYNNTDNKKYIGNLDLNRKFAYEESIRQKRLMLNCYWQVPVLDEKGNVSISWKGPELVPFDEIVLDINSFETYYHDSDQDFYHSYSPEKQQIIDDWMRIKEDRWKKIFDSIEKRKLLYEQALARRDRKELLAYYYPLIKSGEIIPIAFLDERTNLWGFKVNDCEVIHAMYYEVMPFIMGFAFVKKQKYWGIIDFKGNKCCNFEYNDVCEISSGIYSLSKRNDNNYVFIQDGSLTLYEDAKIQDNGYCRVKLNKCWGVVNKRNSIVVPFEYDHISEYREGLISVIKHGKWGFIDERGEMIIPFEYESLYSSQNSEIIRVKKDGKWGIIDKGNKVLVPIDFDDIGLFKNSRAIARKNRKWGIIDERGNTKCPFEYDCIDDDDDNYWKVMKRDYQRGRQHYNWYNSNEKWGLVNLEGDIVVPCEYDAIYPPISGKIRCKKNMKWGYVNEKGEEKIPFEYDEAEDFVEGKARVQMCFHWGYIDENGDEIYSIFEEIGKGIIKYKSVFYDKWGLMTESHMVVTKPIFQQIDNFNNGFAMANKDWKWGIINEKGGTIIPFEYDALKLFVDGKAIAIIRDKWGCVDENRKVLIPFEYDEITYFEGKFLLFMNRGYDFLGNPRKKLVKKVNFSIKHRTVDLSKIESNTIYLATVTGLHKVGVFIYILGIGDSLIPTKHIKEIGKSINNFKKGMQMKVQLLNIYEEKQQATFKIIEEELLHEN